MFDDPQMLLGSSISKNKETFWDSFIFIIKCLEIMQWEINVEVWLESLRMFQDHFQSGLISKQFIILLSDVIHKVL